MGALRLLQSFYCYKVVVMIGHTVMHSLCGICISKLAKERLFSSCALSKQTWSSLCAFVWDSCCFSERNLGLRTCVICWGGNS